MAEFLSRHYNAMTGFPRRVDAIVASIQPWVRDWNPRVVLDAGCGGGALMLALERLGIEVVGLDLSEPMLRLAMANAREAGKTFRFCGAPFSSAGAIFPEHFDAVFVLGNALFGHDTDAEMRASLRGLHDCLRPGGRILIQNLNPLPFVLGGKRVINRRTVGETRYLRFAVPVEPERLFFAAIAEGPGDSFDVTGHIWNLWEHTRLRECLVKSGFAQIEVYGGIDRSVYAPRTSTDLVISAARPR